MNKKYYICVTPFFPSENNWRGAYIYDQVKAIIRNSRYKVIVFMPSNKHDHYCFDGIDIYLFSTLAFPSYLFNGFFNGHNSRQFLKCFNNSNTPINEVSYVHCHSGINGIYGFALKNINPNIKVLLQHHNLDAYFVMNGKFSNWRLNKRYRAKKCIELFNNVDLHICISSHVKDSLISFPMPRTGECFEPYINCLKNINDLPQMHDKKCYILYNGVDNRIFKIRNTNKTSKDVFRIGCIANFQVLKDHITLVKAFELLINKGYVNMRLSLLGTGDTKQSIIEYITNHNMSEYVEFPSEVKHEELPEYYHSLDLFILPSVFEGFGCVYTEAAACGVPFIGVENQGASEYIYDEDKNKWLIKPHDYSQLSALIENYYNLRYSQQLTKYFNIDYLIRNYLDYLRICFH